MKVVRGSDGLYLGQQVLLPAVWKAKWFSWRIFQMTMNPSWWIALVILLRASGMLSGISSVREQNMNSFVALSLVNASPWNSWYVVFFLIFDQNGKCTPKGASRCLEWEYHFSRGLGDNEVSAWVETSRMLLMAFCADCRLYASKWIETKLLEARFVSMTLFGSRRSTTV